MTFGFLNAVVESILGGIQSVNMICSIYQPASHTHTQYIGALAPRAMGRGGYMVITGPKGSGKSAVVREVSQ